METITYKNYSIKIEADGSPENPRTSWDNLGTMVCFHGRYNLGDKHDFSEPEDFQEFLKKEENNIVALPLYLYDHSGITMKTSPFSCPWDSGKVGYIYVTKERIRKELNCKKVSKAIREKVIKILESEVKIYDQYLTGEVYSYSIEDREENLIDSCSGFYGYKHEESGLMEYARNAIDSHIASERNKHFEQLKAWIKSKVNFEYRKPCLV